jgi:hypothetical protein
MGFPVTIRPRRNPVNDTKFFAVLSGPFPAKKAESVLQQLQNQGFSSARLLKGNAAERAQPSN